MNLLQETLDVLEKNGVDQSQVLYCAILGPDSFWQEQEPFYFSWQEFKELADFDYDNGFGGHEVNSKLVVVGNNWWLERGEYDGSEWWEFKTLPEKPLKYQKPKTLTSYWDDDE